MELATLQDLQKAKSEILEAVEKLLKSNPEKQTKWVKSKRAREILNCSPGTLQSLRMSNSGLKFTRVGGTIYYDVESIHQILENNVR